MKANRSVTSAISSFVTVSAGWCFLLFVTSSAGLMAQTKLPSIKSDEPVIRFGPGSTWSASTRAGRTLSGTWTGAIDRSSGTATGTWTVRDGKSQILLSGTWSAVKSARGWRGSWRALVQGQAGERSGNWSSTVQLPPDTSLAGLFELAVQQAVNGTWQSAGQSGEWSIRAVR